MANKDLEIALIGDDDGTILKLLAANKNYDNEELFENLMTRRFPSLLRLRNTERFLRRAESWKQFYLRMIRYISLLKEEYGISYSPSYYGFNPEEFYNSLKAKKLSRETANRLMLVATQMENRNLIEYFISKGADDFNHAMARAAKAGNMQLVNFFISKGADDWIEGYIWAVSGGNLNVVHFFENERIKAGIHW